MSRSSIAHHKHLKRLTTRPVYRHGYDRCAPVLFERELVPEHESEPAPPLAVALAACRAAECLLGALVASAPLSAAQRHAAAAIADACRDAREVGREEE